MTKPLIQDTLIKDTTLIVKSLIVLNCFVIYMMIILCNRQADNKIEAFTFPSHKTLNTSQQEIVAKKPSRWVTKQAIEINKNWRVNTSLAFESSHFDRDNEKALAVNRSRRKISRCLINAATERAQWEMINASLLIRHPNLLITQQTSFVW